MSRKFSIAIMLILFVAALLPLSNCKNFGSPDYTLTVEVHEGVLGSPASGVTVHKEFDEIDYDYEAEDENKRIEVLANSSRYALSGTITMYTNIHIVVRIIDLRDTWTFQLEDLNENTQELTIVFSGPDVFGGTFTDNNGNTGTWVVDGSDLTITYDNWLNYKLIGTIETMSGDWGGNGTSGDWSAVRVQE